MARSGVQAWLSNSSAVRVFSEETSTKVSVKEVLQEIRELAESGDIYIALEVLDNVIDDADADKPMLEKEKWNHFNLPARLARARRSCSLPDEDEEDNEVAISTGQDFGAGSKKGGFFAVLPQMGRNRRCPETAILWKSTKAGDATSASRRARSTGSGLASGASANSAVASSSMPRRTRWAW
eukprot:TRINITY_DN1454_c0_g1_i1.p2 TRINITY_DN1454_c0_g1~~TRINITY_DN1454_c0_g1_i1.p2  ORF type:complete len:182 (-),score=32.88 TRINITY_DN1454_c0_g1_i1:730-1275(-)